MKTSNSNNRWIKILEIRNVGLHEDTIIEFSPGLNVISGGNGRGKSTIIRALRFLCYNRPTDRIETQLLRWGKKSLIVKVTMNDGSWVMREKGKDVNIYWAFDPNKHSKPLQLEGFKTNVPTEVTEIMGVSTISMGEKDAPLNISAQGEDFFMLGDSKSNVARQLYAMTCLYDVRGALDTANKEMSALTKDTKSERKKVEDLRAKVAKFPDIDILGAGVEETAERLEKVKEDYSRAKGMQEIYDSLIAIKEKAVPVKRRVQKTAAVLEQLKDANIASLRSQAVCCGEMISLDKSIKDKQEQIMEVRNRSRSLIQIKRLDLQPVVEKAAQLEGMLELVESISAYDDNIAGQKTKMARHKQLLTEIEREEKALADKLFGVQGERVCPFCKQEVGDDLAEHIIQEGISQ